MPTRRIETWRAFANPDVHPEPGHEVYAVEQDKPAPPYTQLARRGEGELHFLALHAQSDEDLEGQLDLIAEALGLPRRADE